MYKRQAIDNEETADMLVGIYDWAIITDHQKKKSYIASYGLHSQTQQQWSSILALINRQEKKPTAILSVSGPLRSQLGLKQYQTAFNKIKHYIREGDCYQVNLAKRFEINAKGDPWHAYTLLRQQNGAAAGMLKVKSDRCTRPLMVKFNRP